MNKKVILSLIAFLILAAGVVAGIILVQKNQDLREKAAPATSLSFSPSSVSKTPGQTFSLAVAMSTAENSVTGVDLEIAYDPTVIKIDTISPTSSISNLSTEIKNTIDNTTGKVRYAAFTADKTKGVSGNVNVLTINGSVLSTATTGAYQITYTSNTIVAAVLEGVNVVVGKSPATVNVTSTSATATATSIATSTAHGATATPTATARASATATAGANSQASNTPTPTPTRTATPTATATTGSNATVTPTPTSATGATTTPTAISGATSTPVGSSAPIPVTGISYPFAITISFAALLIISSLLLAL